MKKALLTLPLAFLLATCTLQPQESSSSDISGYDVVWTSQSGSSQDSMPCGGGDVGLNVWVEDGELLFYIARSGMYDRNNTLLKQGRVRVRFPSPLREEGFCQRLNLADGSVTVEALAGGNPVKMTLWADVFKPVVHLAVDSGKPCDLAVKYESWRYEDRPLRRNESYQNSYKWQPPRKIAMDADIIEARDGSVIWRHENPDYTMTDVCIEQQDMSDIRDGFYDPLISLVSGGKMSLPGFEFAGTADGQYLDTPFRSWTFLSKGRKRHRDIQITLFSEQTDAAGWLAGLEKTEASVRLSADRKASAAWWARLWDRSFVMIDTDTPGSKAWSIGRNYQLFRYQLACNAYGEWPTKFNGGLFTYDPVFVNPDRPFTPDFRNWGGGTYTAQNQRLVYFPMIKSGDLDFLPSQLDFYRRNLPNAEARTRHSWGHDGASFTEQIEDFGLPNPSEYGWKRPEGFDPGMEYNNWLEYEWDTVLEFCHMAFEAYRYAAPGEFPLKDYIPLTESVLTFFDEHYRYLAASRGEQPLDAEGHLRLYPGSACETYKITDAASSTVAALQTVAAELRDWYRAEASAEKAGRWDAFLATLPPIPLRSLDTPDGPAVAIAPAKSWERINNSEAPQLYPVWPWRIYGPTSEDLEVARNTYLFDPDVVANRTHTGWKQYNIFAACLGMTDEARELTELKFADAPVRFPTFWGPGYDWTPDHNWGGSAMIGLQEMLLQTDGDKILLFPAWPADWDVHFRLRAPGATTVDAVLRSGRLESLTVTPASRLADVVSLLPSPQN